MNSEEELKQAIKDLIFMDGSANSEYIASNIMELIQTHYIARKDVQAAIPGNPITPNVDRYNEGWSDALAIVKSNLGMK